MNATALTARKQHELIFGTHTIKTITRDGVLWMSGTEVGKALEYSSPDKAIKQLFGAHADEFTATMTKVIKVATAGGKQAVRFFSLRGAHLLAMFARTPVAKAFRVWVLDILDCEVADLRAAATAGDRVDTDTRHNIYALCSHMEYLRSWWERYGSSLRGLNRNMAAAIHDHFTDGAGFSRSLVRQLHLKSSREAAAGYPWDGTGMDRVTYSQQAQRGAA